MDNCTLEFRDIQWWFCTHNTTKKKHTFTQYVRVRCIILCHVHVVYNEYMTILYNSTIISSNKEAVQCVLFQYILTIYGMGIHLAEAMEFTVMIKNGHVVIRQPKAKVPYHAVYSVYI